MLPLLKMAVEPDRLGCHWTRVPNRQDIPVKAILEWELDIFSGVSLWTLCQVEWEINGSGRVLGASILDLSISTWHTVLSMYTFGIREHQGLSG